MPRPHSDGPSVTCYVEALDAYREGLKHGRAALLELIKMAEAAAWRAAAAASKA